MTDGQKLKDAITEFRKTDKILDENLKKAEEYNRQARQDVREQSNRQH